MNDDASRPAQPLPEGTPPPAAGPPNHPATTPLEGRGERAPTPQASETSPHQVAAAGAPDPLATAAPASPPPSRPGAPAPAASSPQALVPAAERSSPGAAHGAAAEAAEAPPAISPASAVAPAPEVSLAAVGQDASGPRAERAPATSTARSTGSGRALATLTALAALATLGAQAGALWLLPPDVRRALAARLDSSPTSGVAAPSSASGAPQLAPASPPPAAPVPANRALLIGAVESLTLALEPAVLRALDGAPVALRLDLLDGERVGGQALPDADPARGREVVGALRAGRLELRAGAPVPPGADPAALYARALETTPAQQPELLMRAAQAGSLEAGARLIELQEFDVLERLDLPRAPALCAWRDAEGAVLGMRAPEVYAVLLYHWAVRDRALPPARVEPLVAEARGLLEAGPREHPLLSLQLAQLLAPTERERWLALIEGQAERLAKRAETLRDPLLRAALFSAAASCDADLGASARAAERFGRAAEGFAIAGAPLKRMDCLSAQASVLEELARAGSGRSTKGAPNRRRTGAPTGAQIAPLYRRAAELCAQLGRELDRAHLLARLAWCISPRLDPKGDWREAAEQFTVAGDAYALAGDARRAVKAYTNAAECLRQAPGEDARADAQFRYEEALELGERLGEPVPGRVFHGLAQVLLAQKEVERAAETFGRAAAQYAREGNSHGRSQALREQATAVQPERHPRGSWSLSAAYAALAAEAAGDAHPDDRAQALFLLGWCLSPSNDQEHGSWERAAEAYRQAVLAYQVSRPAVPGVVHLELGRALRPDHSSRGDWGLASFHFVRAARRLQAEDKLHEATDALLAAAECHEPSLNPTKGDAKRALALYREAEQLAVRHGDDAQRGWALFGQAGAVESKDHKTVLVLQAEQLAEKSGDLRLQAKVRERQGNAAFLEGGSGRRRALRLWREAAELATQAGDTKLAGELRKLVGR